MTWLRGHRRWFGAVALWAMLLLTFGPSLTGLGGPGGVHAACAPGMHEGGAHAGMAGIGGPHGFEHCPYCALVADLVVPTVEAAAPAGGFLVHRAPVRADIGAPPSHAGRATAQPRAPPTLA